MNKYFSEGKKRTVNLLLTAALLIYSFAMLVSCQSSAVYHVAENPALQRSENNGIIVECRYLDRAAIETRHGKDGNPFLAPPYIFTPQYAIIFELKILNNDGAPLKLDIRDVEFYYNDKRYRPMSKSAMEMQIEELTEKGSNRIKQERIAKMFMLGDVKNIEGNSEAKGYLVFMGAMKDKGNGELTLTFLTQDNLEAGELKFNYDFRLNKRNRRR